MRWNRHNRYHCRTWGGKCLLTELLIALPVGVDRVDDLGKGILLILKDELLDNCQRVGSYRQADAGEHRPDAVLRAAVHKVLAVLQAILVAGGHKGPVTALSVNLLCGDQRNNALLDQISELVLPGLDDLINRGKGLGVLLGNRDLLAGKAAFALIECKLKSGRKADACRGGPLESLSGMGHHAAAVVPVLCVLRLIAQIGKHLVAGAVAVNCGEAAAVDTSSVTASMNSGGQSG